MRTSDSNIRDLYQHATAGRGAGDCPESEELSALAVGEVDVATRARLVAHVAECSECAFELTAARDLAADSAGGEGEVATFRPTPVVGGGASASGLRRALPVLLAAALAVCAVGGVMLWRGTTADRAVTDTVRSDGDGLAVDPAPGAVLAAAPEWLRWPAQTGATGYRVVLLDATGDELWSGAVTAEASTDGVLPDTRIAPPQALFTEKAPGSFLWLVEVQGPAQRSRMGPYRLRVESSAEAMP